MNSKEVNQNLLDCKRAIEKRIKNKALNKVQEQMPGQNWIKLQNLNEKERKQYLCSKEKFKNKYINELRILTQGWLRPSNEKLRNTKWMFHLQQKFTGYKKKHLLDECVLH